MHPSMHTLHPENKAERLHKAGVQRLNVRASLRLSAEEGHKKIRAWKSQYLEYMDFVHEKIGCVMPLRK